MTSAGRPYLIKNRKSPASDPPQYWAIQVIWPKDLDGMKLQNKEAFLFLTPEEMEICLARAQTNPETVVAFFDAHVTQLEEANEQP